MKMQAGYRRLRVEQLDRMLLPLVSIPAVPRPPKGWIRAIREATGVTIRELAQRLARAPSVAAHLETSEAEYRITLGKLREAAEALGCDLVYAFVPKGGSVRHLVEQAARAQAEENVRAVEHTMTLEAQGVGRIEDKIDEETRRIVEKGWRR